MRLNKLAKKIFAAGLAVSLVAASAVVSYGAPEDGTTATSEFKYDDTIEGTKELEFTKYLVVDDGVTIPNVGFTFTVAPGDAVVAESILAGLEGATIDYGTDKSSVEFTSASAVKDVTEGKVDGTDVTGTKYAENTAKVNFSNVKFTEPGIYRYKLTEDAPSFPGINVKSTNPLYLDVFVINGSDNKLKIESYVLHTTADKPVAQSEENKNAKDKVTGFVNEYTAQSLTFSKKVEGNQASRSKFFDFTLELTNENMKGSTIAVDVSGAVADKNTMTSITLDDKGHGTATFKLQHGNSIVVKGLPNGTSYTVKESYEDYTPSVSEGNTMKDDTTKKEASVTGQIETRPANVGFTNKKDGTIPTGVILDSAPFILIIGLAAAALVITAARKKVR